MDAHHRSDYWPEDQRPCTVSFFTPLRPIIPHLVFLAYLFITRVFQSSRITFILKYIMLVFTVIPIATFGVFLSIPFFLIGKARSTNYIISHLFGRTLCPLLSCRVACEGKHNKLARAVYVGNHQGIMDFIVLSYVFPRNCVVMAKDIIKYYGPMGIYLYLAQNVFIKRGDRKKALSTMDNVAKDLKEKGVSVFIFAEGTRAKFQNIDMLPFKKGAFHVALQAQVPVIPLVISSYAPFYRPRQMMWKSGVLTLHYDEPISTEPYDTSTIDDLIVKTRARMVHTLGVISWDPEDIRLPKEEFLKVYAESQRLGSWEPQDIQARRERILLLPNGSDDRRVRSEVGQAER